MSNPRQVTFLTDLPDDLLQYISNMFSYRRHARVLWQELQANYVVASGEI